MISFNLHPGDDVRYHESGLQSQLLGRIITASATSFCIQRFILNTDYVDDNDADGNDEEDDDENHSTISSLQPRRNLVEVIFSNDVDEIPKMNVDGIIFVLSTKYLKSEPLSFAGMDNLYFINYKLLSPSNQKVRVEDWLSFRSTGTRSYACDIFNGVRAVRAAISSALNRTSMAQRERATSKIAFFSPNAFNYIRSCLEGTGSYRFRNAHVSLKHIYCDISKKKMRHKICIEEIFLNTNDDMDRFRKIFGVVATKGSRSKHPKVGDSIAPVQFGTTLNILVSLKFSYNSLYESISINMRFHSMVVTRA